MKPTGELLHFGSVRFRINGSGTFLTTLNGLDGVGTNQLPDLTLVSNPGMEPLILADFIGQRGQLTGYVLPINEYFSISKITIFIRPDSSGYPQ